jgi:H+/Cl- antiporter ClcA
MKPKQLASVLIKILGLSLIAHGIPGLINGIIGWLQFASDNRLFTSMGNTSHYWMIVLLDLVPFAVGFALIAGSRWFVEKLFKDEAE